MFSNSNSSKISLNSHLVQLHEIFQFSALIVIIFTIAWSFLVDDLISLWLDSLAIGAHALDLTVYAPYDWLEIRWSLILILATTSALPLILHKLRRFCNPGLLNREKRWLSVISFLSGVIIPLFLILFWLFLLPESIAFFESGSHVEVGARYDAAALISLGLGLSWLIIIAVVLTLSLGFARLFGLVEDGQARFRIRLLLIAGSVVILTLPAVFEGVRFFLAIIGVLIADRISSTAPLAPLGKRNFDVEAISFGGRSQRLALLDCSCEGSCPPLEANLKDGIAKPVCSALCLNIDEQDSLYDLVKHKKIDHLIITGCNGSPMPTQLSKALMEIDCSISGLNWLDTHPMDDSARFLSLDELVD